MSDAPLLSVVIPTRNRTEYVTHALRCMARLNLNGVEVVLHDNSDDRALEPIAKQHRDSCSVQYHYLPKRVSMAENFDLGIACARGDYVCLIGDDDGVTPEIAEGAAWARAQGIETLSSNADSVYRWPDLTMRYYGSSYAGTLSIPRFTGQLRRLDPEVGLRACARQAGQFALELPKVYYGITRRDVLERVRKKAGTVFPGVSPDMAAAVAVATVVKRAALLDYPLVVPGNGGASAAGLGARKQHWGPLEKQHHLPAEFLANWSRLVPRFFSGSTMWAESYVTATRAMGREDLLAYFNVPLLHALCAVFTPQYVIPVLKNFRGALQEVHANRVTSLGFFALSFGRIWLLRARALARNVSGSRSKEVLSILRDLKNIDEAVQAYAGFLSSRGFSFAKAVGA